MAAGIASMQGENRKAGEQVYCAHGGDDAGSYAGDALDAAENDQPDQSGDCETVDPWELVEKAIASIIWSERRI